MQKMNADINFVSNDLDKNQKLFELSKERYVFIF